MARATFHYSAFELTPDDAHPKGATAHRPMVLATIAASNGAWFPCLALPDSGADMCLFPLKLARQLNLDVSAMPKSLTGGVGSAANVTYYDTVSIDLGDGIKFSAYVGFTQGLDYSGIGLLGQSGFFEQFRVEFDLNRKTFSIETA
jgi:hypothetical protein